ncbi:MAG: NUDIX domain-containing protein [Hyphomonadaceae bacterium]
MKSDTASEDMSGGAPPPVPAATVLVVRNSPSLEVLMVRRHTKVAFGGGAWVFPGGKVCEADLDPVWDELSTGTFVQEERAFRVAAARETFEESGVLIGLDAQGRLAAPDLVTGLQAWRPEVERTPVLFERMLREAGLTLALDRLIPFAHWVTPTFEPRRFDTRFYMVAAPEGQISAHDGREAVDHVWTQPQTLLREREAGRAKLMFPTRLNLEVLAGYPDVTAAETGARARPVIRIEPVVIERDGERLLQIPAEAGYSVEEEPMTKVMD